MAISVAGAPVSFGVFELTPDDDGLVLPTADELTTALERTGYAGVDLGPVGFLGRGRELRDRLRGHDLELAGGWVDLPFSDDEAFAAALPALDEALDVFSDALEAHPERAPLPTLADSGDAQRKANPGGGAGHRLDEEGWDRFARNLATAAARVRARGSSRPSTTTRARSSRPRRRSTSSSPARTSTSPSTPATCSSAAATCSRRGSAGARGSTTCTSRTSGSPSCARSSAAAAG